MGRVVGMIILLGGIGLLAFAFNTAYHFFNTPIAGLGFIGNKTQATPPPVNIGAAVFQFVQQLILLGFEVGIGSILSGKGISLYLGAVQWGEPRPQVDRSEPAPETRPAQTSAPSTETAKPAAAKSQNG